MSTTTVEGFSLSHAAILDGSTGAEIADLYGIREGSVEVDIDSVENTGDDGVISTWTWFNYASISIQAGYVPFDVLTLLYGTPVTVTGDESSIPLWSHSSLNQPARPMLVRVPAKTSDQVIKYLDIVLYKVQFEPISFDGPSYKDGLLLNYGGKALMSDLDEKGTVLTDPSIGRLVIRPGPTPVVGDTSGAWSDTDSWPDSDVWV